jgi:hypothetical protein
MREKMPSRGNSKAMSLFIRREIKDCSNYPGIQKATTFCKS